MGIDDVSTKDVGGSYWKPILRHAEDGGATAVVDSTMVLAGVRRYLWVIFLIALAGGLAGAFMSQQMAQTYQAEAVLLYTNPRHGGDTEGIVPHGVSVESVREMVMLPQNLESVRGTLGLDLSVGTLQKMVSTFHVRQSNLVRIYATADNPNLAVDLANTLANVTAKGSRERYHKQATEAYNYYTRELKIAQERLDLAQQAIAEFKQSAHVVEMDMATRAAIDSAIRFEREFQLAELEEQQLKVEYDNLKAEVSDMPEHVVRYEYDQNPMKARMAAREMALLSARTRYGPQNPKVLMIEEELAQLKEAIQDEHAAEDRSEVYEKNFVKEQLGIELMRLKGKLSAAAKRREALQLGLKEAEKEAAEVPGEQQEYARLSRQVTAATIEHEALTQALRTAESAMETERSDVTVYRLATKSALKHSMGTKYLPAIGFAAGGALALFLVMTLQMGASRLVNANQLQRSYLIPHLLTVPQLRKFTLERAEERTLFFMRMLADRVAQLPEGQAIRSVAFTGCKAGEGKSTLAYHLARYYQRLGQKTLYVDFDPEKNPYLESDVHLAPSLEKVLRGEVDVEKAIFKGRIHAMKVGHEPGLKEFMASERMDNLWTHLQAKYDRIVIDAPGLMHSDYSVNLLDRVDCGLFVIGSSVVNKAEVDSCLRELESRRKQPAGLILNNVHPRYIDDLRLSRGAT